MRVRALVSSCTKTVALLGADIATKARVTCVIDPRMNTDELHSSIAAPAITDFTKSIPCYAPFGIDGWISRTYALVEIC